MFSNEHQFDAAYAHVEHAKLHATNNPYNLGHAMELRAEILYQECKFEEVKSEVLRAADAFKRLGATKNPEDYRKILHDIEAEVGAGGLAASSESAFNGEPLEAMPSPTSVNSPPSA